MGRYQFAHVLIQDTLARDLSGARRARLHRRIAETLEELYGAASEAYASELAYHYGEAAVAGDTEKLVRYSLLAGERALATYAYEEALGHFERALAAKEGMPPSTGSGQGMDAEMGALLFGMGRARAAMVQVEEALASLERAFDFYLAAGDVPRAVAVAEYPLPPSAGYFTGAPRLIAAALVLVPPDSPQAGRLLCRYGSTQSFREGDYEGAQQVFRQALAIARQERDAALEMQTLASAAFVDVYHCRFQDSLEKSLLAIELARQPGDPHGEVVAQFGAVMDLYFTGDLEGVGQQGAAGLAAAERLRDRTWLCRLLSGNALVSCCKGDWGAARQFCERALAASPRDVRPVYIRAILEYKEGGFNQGEAYLERLLELMNLTTPGPNVEYGVTALMIPIVGRISGSMDRFDVAEAAAATVLSSECTPFIAMLARVGLALLAVQRGDVSSAREQYAALEPKQGTWVFVGTACWGSWRRPWASSTEPPSTSRLR